jgi:hypothetical protein
MCEPQVGELCSGLGETKTLSKKQLKQKGAWGMAQEGEHLPSKCKALSTTKKTPKQNKIKNKTKQNKTEESSVFSSLA